MATANSDSCNSAECSEDADEAALLQVGLATKHRQHILTAGTSYSGDLKHPSVHNGDILIHLDLTSASEGVWRDLDDSSYDKQKFTVSHKNGRFEFADSETQLIGTPDAEGVIRGEFIHQGVPGGTFTLKQYKPVEDVIKDEASFLQLFAKTNTEDNRGNLLAKHSKAVKRHTLKAGTSYTAVIKHPKFPRHDSSIYMEVTSPTGGVWRDVQDPIGDEQPFRVSYKGQRIALWDEDTQLVGMVDHQGRIQGDMFHGGVGGGFFAMIPNN